VAEIIALKKEPRCDVSCCLEILQLVSDAHGEFASMSSQPKMTVGLLGNIDERPTLDGYPSNIEDITVNNIGGNTETEENDTNETTVGANNHSSGVNLKDNESRNRSMMGDFSRNMLAATDPIPLKRNEKLEKESLSVEVQTKINEYTISDRKGKGAERGDVDIKDEFDDESADELQDSNITSTIEQNSKI
jgi:hypothetical protein